MHLHCNYSDNALFVVCVCVCVCLLQAGMAGSYVLDEYGDRDVNFSMIFTSTKTAKVRLLSIQQLAQTVRTFLFILCLCLSPVRNPVGV